MCPSLRGKQKSMKTTHGLVSTLLLLGACGGGSDLDPGSGNDGGDGTSTLTVTGSVSAEPRLSNARNRGDFTTEFSVRVERAGQVVSTGSVEVTSAGGTIALVYDANNNERWGGTAPGYDEVYVLDVEDGADNLIGVRVDGPDIHFFTAPTAGATVDSTLPLPVAWSADDGADSASVRADNINHVAISDTGTYSLAPGALKAKPDQAETNELELRRTNRVSPSGGAGGSEWVVSVENRIEVVAQPNPAL